MSNSVFPTTLPARTQEVSRISQWLLDRLLGGLTRGSLFVVLPDGRRLVHRCPQPGVDVGLVLHRWRALGYLLFGGNVGFGDSYGDGDWSTPDLAALLQFGDDNNTGSNMVGSNGRFIWLHRMMHARRTNSCKGSRRNIAAHYDLSNEFYATWLDPSMTYSSALYSRHGESLEEAQRAKQDRAMALLELRPGQTVLEIGSGWGGLAARMAGDAGTHVTGLTLSHEQHRLATTRMAQARLADKVDIALRDYREEQGAYDRIVSIEMLEAVGEAYWPVFFERLRARLKRDGRAVLQVITIAEERFAAYRATPDFVQMRVFPGGMLPTVQILREQIAKAGLRLSHMEHFGQSYAETLAEWTRRFHAACAQHRTLGLDESFLRRWHYYLAYSEAGFRTGAVDVGLYQLTRDDCAA